jgi:hypothetical protein
VVTHRARPLAVLVVAFLGLAGLLLVAGPAHAATPTVTLSQQGPSPATITVAQGQTVTFVNNDSVPHRVRHTSGAWTFDKSIPANKSVTTPPFAAGTFGYSDDFATVVLGVPRSVSGSVVVPKTAPSPSPSATRRPTPAPSRSAAPRPSVSASPAASATPLPTQSGTAVLPGLGTGVLPTPVATPLTGPAPQVAPGVSPNPSSTPAVASIRYGGKDGLVQPSSHRYGLPAALAVVGIVGVVSLLVRLLLAQPEAARRTEEA